MLKYNNIGSAIEIKLNNQFSVIAMYITYGEPDENEEETYLVNMWLKAATIDDGLPIDMQKIGIQHINATKSTIKKRITRMVSNAYEGGNFNYYIDRYNYYCDCFEIGNDQLEGGK